MSSLVPIRRRLASASTSAAMLLAFFAPRAICGQALPPSAPTQPAPTHPAAPPPVAAALPQKSAEPIQTAYHARVELTAGQLSIRAEDSSLNQILVDVARLTGMKITGGVTEERVYGAYGPAPPQDVLTALLEGTGTNILLLQDAQHGVQELVLTPRHGGVSPPSPNASRGNDREDPDLPADLGGRRRGMPPNMRPPLRQFENPPASQPPPNPQPAETEAPAVTSPPAATPPTTTQESPNGVKTPQQIYEELVKQQQQQQTTPPPTTPPND
jgi:hypothetical protein